MKLKESYKIWQTILPHIAKSQRHTIGAKIDGLLLETLGLSYEAAYASASEKTTLVKRAAVKNDLTKFFLLVAWESKMLEDKQYLRISHCLAEAGKMLSGWRGYLEKKTPAV